MKKFTKALSLLVAAAMTLVPVAAIAEEYAVDEAVEVVEESAVSETVADEENAAYEIVLDDAAVDEAATDEITPDENTTDETAPDENTTDENTTDEAAPDENTTDEITPDENTTDEIASDENTTDEAAPDENTTDETASDENTTDEAAPDENTTDEATPDENTTDETTPDEDNSEEEIDWDALFEEIVEEFRNSEYTAFNVRGALDFFEWTSIFAQKVDIYSNEALLNYVVFDLDIHSMSELVDYLMFTRKPYGMDRDTANGTITNGTINIYLAKGSDASSFTSTYVADSSDTDTDTDTDTVKSGETSYTYDKSKTLTITPDNGQKITGLKVTIGYYVETGATSNTPNITKFINDEGNAVISGSDFDPSLSENQLGGFYPVNGGATLFGNTYNLEITVTTAPKEAGTVTLSEEPNNSGKYEVVTGLVVTTDASLTSIQSVINGYIEQGTLACGSKLTFTVPDAVVGVNYTVGEETTYAPIENGSWQYQLTDQNVKIVFVYKATISDFIVVGDDFTKISVTCEYNNKQETKTYSDKESLAKYMKQQYVDTTVSFEVSTTDPLKSLTLVTGKTDNNTEGTKQESNTSTITCTLAAGTTTLTITTADKIASFTLALSEGSANLDLTTLTYNCQITSESGTQTLSLTIDTIASTLKNYYVDETTVTLTPNLPAGYSVTAASASNTDDTETSSGTPLTVASGGVVSGTIAAANTKWTLTIKKETPEISVAKYTANVPGAGKADVFVIATITNYNSLDSNKLDNNGTFTITVADTAHPDYSLYNGNEQTGGRNGKYFAMGFTPKAENAEEFAVVHNFGITASITYDNEKISSEKFDLTLGKPASSETETTTE